MELGLQKKDYLFKSLNEFALKEGYYLKGKIIVERESDFNRMLHQKGYDGFFDKFAIIKKRLLLILKLHPNKINCDEVLDYYLEGNGHLRNIKYVIEEDIRI